MHMSHTPVYWKCLFMIFMNCANCKCSFADCSLIQSIDGLNTECIIHDLTNTVQCKIQYNAKYNEPSIAQFNATKMKCSAICLICPWSHHRECKASRVFFLLLGVAFLWRFLQHRRLARQVGAGASQVGSRGSDTTLQNSHCCTLHAAHWAVYTAHWTLNTEQCALHSAHCTLCTAHEALHMKHYAVHMKTAHWILFTAQCALQTMCIISTNCNILCSANKTVHSKHCKQYRV